MPKKAWMFMSIALLIVLSLSFYNQYKKNMELNCYRSAFVGHLHGEISNCIYLISKINSSDVKVQQGAFKSLVNQLGVVDQVVTDAHNFMDQKVGYGIKGTFYNIGLIIDGGLMRNGQEVCVGFLEDDKLSKSEINFLLSLKNDLEKIANRMYPNESKQENYNLSVKEINEMMAPFYDIDKLNLSN